VQHRYQKIPIARRIRLLKENIPDVMKESPHWCEADLKMRTDEDGNPVIDKETGKIKWDKIPRYVDGTIRRGTQGSPRDREKLTTFNRALARMRAGACDGLGYAVLPDDPVSIADIDRDYAIAANEDLIASTWCERSVGGDGAHAVVLGDIGRYKATRGVQVFSDHQFVVMTGEPWNPMLGFAPLMHAEDAKPLLHIEFSINGAEYKPQRHHALQATFYNEIERKKILRALRAMPCKDATREEWLHVGMALHSADPDPDGPTFKIWERWSRSDPGRYKDGECLAKWTKDSDFKPDGGITLATLYHYANEIDPKWRREAKPSKQMPIDPSDHGNSIKDIENIDFGKPRIFLDGLIAEGLTLLTGQKKLARKTYFVLQCAAMASIGDSFIGCRSTQPLRCMAYMLEEGDKVFDVHGKPAIPADVVKERLKQMGLWDIAKRGDLRFRWKLPELQDGGKEQVEADAKNFDIIFVDSRQKIFNEDAEKANGIWSKDYQRLLPLRDISREHHCAIVIVNHSSKGSDARDAIDAGASTGGLDAAVDGILVLQNPDKDNTDRIRLTIHHRRIEPTIVELRWDRDTYRFEKVGSWLGTGRLADVLDIVVRATVEKKASPSTLQVSRTMFGQNADKNRANVNRILLGLRRMGLVEFAYADGDTKTKLWLATPQAISQRSEGD